MKKRTSKKYKNGRLVVEVNTDACDVYWAFLVNAEVENYGQMEIEMYIDGTWLPYEETYGPARWIPKVFEPILMQMFRKVGMRDMDE